ncbi:aromatic acid/H+ symport family MFS transporter [Pseudomonas entomophila]|uniref:MFS transporter n=1 Tax=Pseudomonas entomophila TaxID=312306 RepID=UPI0015E3C5F5|nr:MFS transporter [Pseudomonas entomophila]MBA1190673.1 aromatic acid/H+ symport family MFS transporter [Pseudomonas entomophila]
MSGIIDLSIGTLLAGPLADRFGKLWIIIAALRAMGLFCLTFAFMSSLHSFTGMATGATMPNIITLLAECAPLRRRSLLVTSAWCSFGLDGTLCSLVSEHLIQLYSWRSVFVTGGALPLVLGLVFLF